jgi:hypothetical protein
MTKTEFMGRRYRAYFCHNLQVFDIWSASLTTSLVFAAKVPSLTTSLVFPVKIPSLTPTFSSEDPTIFS